MQSQFFAHQMKLDLEKDSFSSEMQTRSLTVRVIFREIIFSFTTSIALEARQGLSQVPWLQLQADMPSKDKTNK